MIPNAGEMRISENRSLGGSDCIDMCGEFEMSAQKIPGAVETSFARQSSFLDTISSGKTATLATDFQTLIWGKHTVSLNQCGLPKEGDESMFCAAKADPGSPCALCLIIMLRRTPR